MADDPKMWWISAMHTPVVAYLPGTEEIVRSHSHEELWVLWLKECNARGIELANPKAQFQDCCCRALPPEKRAKCCAFVTEEGTPPLLKQARVIGLAEIREFWAKVRSWKQSDEVVSQAEADKRAATCVMCEQNRPASLWGCPSCTGILTEIADNVLSLTKGRKTSSDAQLEHCAVCGCSNRIVAFLPMEVIRKHRNPDHVWPSHCWRLEGESDVASFEGESE